MIGLKMKFEKTICSVISVDLFLKVLMVEKFPLMKSVMLTPTCEGFELDVMIDAEIGSAMYATVLYFQGRWRCGAE